MIEVVEDVEVVSVCVVVEVDCVLAEDDEDAEVETDVLCVRTEELWLEVRLEVLMELVRDVEALC